MASLAEESPDKNSEEIKTSSRGLLSSKDEKSSPIESSPESGEVSASKRQRAQEIEKKRVHFDENLEDAKKERKRGLEKQETKETGRDQSKIRYGVFECPEGRKSSREIKTQTIQIRSTKKMAERFGGAVRVNRCRWLRTKHLGS